MCIGGEVPLICHREPTNCYAYTYLTWLTGGRVRTVVSPQRYRSSHVELLPGPMTRLPFLPVFVIHCRPRGASAGSSAAHWLAVGPLSYCTNKNQGRGGLTHPGFSWPSLQHPPGSFRGDRKDDMGLVLGPGDGGSRQRWRPAARDEGFSG